MKIKTTTIKSTGRKLKAKWTPELAKDVKAYMTMPSPVVGDDVPAGLVETDFFLKGKLYERTSLKDNNVFLFLGHCQIPKNVFGLVAQYWFLSADKSVCFVYAYDNQAVKEFQQIQPKKIKTLT